MNSYLAHPDLASRSLVGKIDATGRIRVAGGDLTMNGVNFYFAVHLVGHRQHFVKFQESDLTKGACSREMAALFLPEGPEADDQGAVLDRAISP